MKFSIPNTLVCVLLILKLMNQIDISWLWVFAPWWIPASFIAGFFGIAGLGVLIWELIKNE